MRALETGEDEADGEAGACDCSQEARFPEPGRPWGVFAPNGSIQHWEDLAPDQSSGDAAGENVDEKRLFTAPAKGRKALKGRAETVLEAYRASREAIARRLLRAFVRAEDIDDVLQEAFLRAYQAEAGGEIKSPRAYLFITARNIVYKEFRRRARFVSNALEEFDVDDGEAPVDMTVHDRWKFSTFMDAVASLPDQCRRVFLLRKFYGYSYRQIAKQLGISEKTVENHLLNGLKRCGAWMRDKGYDDAPQSRAKRGVSAVEVQIPEEASEL